MNNAVDVLVLGGGPGGYTAALYAARAGLSVLVLERLSAGGQMATTGTGGNYPGFEDGVDGFELGEKMQRQAQRFGARTVLAEVREVALTESPKRVETDRGTFLGRTVVVAEHRLYFLTDLIDRAFYLRSGVLERVFTGEQFRSLPDPEREALGLRTLTPAVCTLPSVESAGTKEGLSIEGLACAASAKELPYSGTCPFPPAPVRWWQSPDPTAWARPPFPAAFAGC